MRKQKYKPGRYQSAGNDSVFIPLYRDQVQSAAFMDLTKNQRLLYIYIRFRQFEKRKPKTEYRDIESLQDDLMIFYSIGNADSDGLYSRKNETKFRGDMKALIEHGFISVTMNGKNQRKKSIYKLSDGWQDWKPG